MNYYMGILGPFYRAVIHKMCSDEQKCAVMKVCFAVMNHEEIKTMFI